MNANFISNGLARLKDKRGSMFVVSYLVMTVLIIITAAYGILTINERQVVERLRRYTLALHIAESGINRAVYDLKADFADDTSWFDGTINGNTITINSTSYTDMPYTATAINGGNYTVSLKSVAGQTRQMWVKSTGTLGDVTRTIETYVKVRRNSPWDNAIFGGSGASGSAINGNVSVHGSVHILGSGLQPTDLAMTMGGGAELTNNYAGMPSNLMAKVPALPTGIFNGEIVQTLNAVLRIKQGEVSMSGTANIGTADVPGNTAKETVDATYVTNGFVGGTSNIYSDNGYSQPYDLGNTMTFPSLSVPYQGYATYQAYLRDHALIVSGMTITPGSSFTYSNAYGTLTMDGNGNMTVSGIVYVDGGTSSGNLTFEESGSKKTINYTGSGSLLVTGNVNIDVNLYTSGNSSFPNNILGIMTPNSMTFNQASIDAMGVFYAEGTVTVQKQTNVVGSIVSNYFNLGTNVPNVYYVPALVDYLPPGMITSAGSWYMMIVSWRET